MYPRFIDTDVCYTTTSKTTPKKVEQNGGQATAKRLAVATCVSALDRQAPRLVECQVELARVRCRHSLQGFPCTLAAGARHLWP